MKFKVLSNPNFDYKKRKKPKKPKTETSIPDKDLVINKGDSFKQTTKAQDEYFYIGKPYGVEKPHV